MMHLTVTALDIRFNELETLPKAFKFLTNLKILEIYQNHIKSYDVDVMQALGQTVTTLGIGADANYKWPPELRYMFGLKTLRVFYSELEWLPTDAFVGFEKTLASLQLEYTRLSSIPRAICSLTKLISFSFNFNEFLSSASNLMPTCAPLLTSVRTAIIIGNKLQVFPAVFEHFPALTTLKVTNNSNLVYIDETVTDRDSSLINLDISFNGFEQFPSALRKLTRLQSLNLSYNKIETIESSNIPNLTNLIEFDLSHNPLTYISPDAFTGISDVEVLKLDGVALDEFPKAIKVLRKLRALSLEKNKIICSCRMTWILTEWKEYQQVSISGNCGSSTLSLEDFIEKRLPECPTI